MAKNSALRAEMIETFRTTRKDTLDYWPEHLTSPLLALPKRTRQALGMVLDCILMQLAEWQEEGRVNEAKDPTSTLEDLILDLQMLVNLTDDESDYDGSDPDYTETGWLLIDPMDPAGPPNEYMPQAKAREPKKQ